MHDVKRELGLIFPNLVLDVYGDVSELGDEHRCPGKSSLFFLTDEKALETYHTEIGLDLWHSTPLLGVVRCAAALP